MRFTFDLREHRGCVEVTVVANDDPESLGCRPSGRSFPVCTATVSCAGRGYDAAVGWIQLVRSTDGASGGLEFEMDPYEPLGALPHPFRWFGFAPTLFDAPSRRTRADLEWTAHSFLSFIAQPHEARAILGFSWGFVVAGGAGLDHAGGAARAGRVGQASADPAPRTSGMAVCAGLSPALTARRRPSFSGPAN